jgi:hypothetical protein
MTANQTKDVVMDNALIHMVVLVPVKATVVRARAVVVGMLLKNVPNVVWEDRVSEIMNARQVNTAVVRKENVPALVWENLALKAVSVEKTNIAVVPISSTARQVAVENFVPEIATVRPKDCVVVVMRNVQFVAAQKKDIVG